MDAAGIADGGPDGLDLARWAARGRALSVLTDTELGRLGRAAVIEDLPAGTRLLSTGQRPRSISLLRRGQVELFRGAGRRRVVVEILRPGDLLGVVPWLAERPSEFGARAITAVTLIRFREEGLRRILDRPDLAGVLLASVATRLERTHRRLVEVTSGDLACRVATLLLDESDGRPGPIRLPQSTLAELLGASRSRVNRVLKTFERGGMVRVAYRSVEVTDAAALRRVAA
jgi:CRP-like cAMP-binding protein